MKWSCTQTSKRFQLSNPIWVWAYLKNKSTSRNKSDINEIEDEKGKKQNSEDEQEISNIKSINDIENIQQSDDETKLKNQEKIPTTKTKQLWQ